MGFNSPLPVRLPEECRKAANIIRSFVDSGNAAIDKQVVPRYVMEKAAGFAIFTVVKAGFVFSARAGSGVVIARLDDGSWSAPSAIGIGGVGFGGQMGAEVTDFFIVLNSRAAVATFMSAGSLTLGGNLSIAVGPLGRNAEGSGTLNTNGRLAAMYSYSKTKGLFGGVSVEGSVIVERQDANRLAYGAAVSSKRLLSGAVDSPEWAQPLVDQITRSTKLPGGQTWRKRDEEESRGEFDREREGGTEQAGYAFGKGVGAGGSVSKANRKRAGSLASTFGKSSSSSSPSPSPRPDGPRRLSSLNPFSSSGRSTPGKSRGTSEQYNAFGPEGDIDEGGKDYGFPREESGLSKDVSARFGAFERARTQTSTADLMIWDNVPPKSSGMTKSSTDSDLLGSWASNGRGLTASFDKLSTREHNDGNDPWTSRGSGGQSSNENDFLPRETRSNFATADWQLPTSSRTLRKMSQDEGPSRIRKERPFSSFFEARSVSDGGDDQGAPSATRYRSDSGPGERPFAAYDSPLPPTSPSVSAPRASVPKIPLKAGLEDAQDGLPRAIGLYDFEPSAAGDLGFKAGQIVVVLSKVGDGKWWNGRNPVTGETGIFPSSYVETLERPKTAGENGRHEFARSRSYREEWD